MLPIAWVKTISRDELEGWTRAVLVGLIVFASETGECWPRVSTLAEVIGCSERTAKRALRKLEAEGWIIRQRRYRKGGGQRSSLYRLNMSKGDRVTLLGVTE